MEDVITKSIKFTSCLKYDNDFNNSNISSSIPKSISSSIPVLSTFFKETPKKNKELETDKKDFKELLDELDLDELDLDEVITIVKDYETSDDDNFSNRENINYDYFEIGDGCDPNEIKKLSPWTKNGPIFKKLPDCNEIENFIQNKKCMCLLLNCQRTVLLNNILVKKSCSYNFFVNKKNWLNFLCPDHKKEVTERYVYNSNKNI